MSIYQNTKTHLHHIVPKRMGGTDDPSNLIELTIYDHAIAHRHLWKMYGDARDHKAYTWLMSIADQGDEHYEKLSESLKQKWKDPSYRQKVKEIRSTDDYKLKKSKANSDRWNNDGFREKMSKTMSTVATKKMKKQWQNQEYRDKMTAKNRERWKDPEYRERMREATKRGMAAAKARRAAATTQES